MRPKVALTGGTQQNHYRISFGAWTPKMASPDASTETTPWTMASRVLVIGASLLIMKRK
jgi:hypothetical protein